MCPFHWRRIMFVCRYIYAFIFCVIFKNSCHNTLFNFVSIFPHVSQFELKFLIAIIFYLIFHLVARGLRCQKTSFKALQRFLFDYLEFFFILEKKSIYEHNFSLNYPITPCFFFLIQNFSSLEKLFFHHFFAIVFSWKQLPLKLLF